MSGSHRFRLQFRAEAFNHVSSLVGDNKELAGLQDPIFGIAGGTNPPRNPKSGVKLNFRRLRRRIDAAASTHQLCIGLATIDIRSYAFLLGFRESTEMGSEPSQGRGFDLEGSDRVKPADKSADYFETCRRKRNTIDYTFSNVATQTEAK